MVAGTREEKITYTTMSVEQAESFNRAYDEALDRVTGKLGQDYPIYIGGEALTPSTGSFEDRSPNDTRILIGRFPDGGADEAAQAVAAARAATAAWGNTPWQERLRTLRRAGPLIPE